jgi:hypothetical protein
MPFWLNSVDYFIEAQLGRYTGTQVSRSSLAEKTVGRGAEATWEGEV